MIRVLSGKSITGHFAQTRVINASEELRLKWQYITSHEEDGSRPISEK